MLHDLLNGFLTMWHLRAKVLWKRMHDFNSTRILQKCVWNQKFAVTVMMIIVIVTFLHICVHLYPSKDLSASHSRLKSKPYDIKNRAVISGFDAPINNTTGSSGSPLKILILSYMRSGSTLCGDLLQAHPDVFYVYEPLLYLWDFYAPEKNFDKETDVRKRIKGYWRSSEQYIPKPSEFLDYMFRCNLTSYNMNFLTNVVLSRDFFNAGCKNSKGFNIVKMTDKCRDNVSKRCNESKAILQKVVRFSMAEVDEYLMKNPSVRIIHLNRDPRGVLLSRMRFNNKTTGEMHNNYTNVCRRMWEDISFSQRISQKHWGKILTVRYEDLAQDPLSMTATLYGFAGLELLPSVREFVHKTTSSDSIRSNGKIAGKKTFRKNPFQTAYRWRQILPYELVKKVDMSCRNVLNAMGYLSFSSEQQMRNFNFPAKSERFGKGLMTAWLI